MGVGGESRVVAAWLIIKKRRIKNVNKDGACMKSAKVELEREGLRI
jgi:hypothetical protein